MIPSNHPPIHNPKVKLIDWSYWLAWGALWLSIFYLITSYGDGLLNYRIVHNSDASFMWVFYRDVLARGTTQGWDLPTNPYIFPDMLLFIPIDFVVNNVNLSSVFFAVAQLLITLLGLLWLQRELFGTNRLPQTFTLLAFTLTLLFISTWEHIFYYLAIMPLHHFGVLMVIPYALVLLLRALHPGSTPRQWLCPTMALFILVILTALSDSLFIIQWVLPAILAVIVWQVIGGRYHAFAWMRVLMVGASILVAAMLGQWMRQLIVPLDKLLLYSEMQDHSELVESMGDFTQWAIQIVRADTVLAGFWLSSIFAIFMVMVISLRGNRSRDLPDNAPRYAVPITLQITLQITTTTLVLSFLAAIASTLITDNFGGSESGRYFLNAIYMPLWMGWPLFLALTLLQPNLQPRQQGRDSRLGTSWMPPFLAPFLAIFLAVGLILFMLATFRPAALAAVPAYQDPVATCLLQETEKRNLRYGLAEYWQANYLTAVTQGKLRVVSVAGSLSPDLWNSTPHNYEYPFEFIIVNPHVNEHWQIDDKTLIRKFGPPIDSFRCDDFTVYTYDYDSNLHLQSWFPHHPILANFDQIGEVAELYGYTLYSHVDATTVGMSLGASDQDGTLAYAPLLALPAGHYAVELDMLAENRDVGRWEIHTIKQDEREIINQEPITQAGNLQIAGAFTLTKQTNVDIVVKYEGTGALYVDRIRVVRVDPASPIFDFAQAESQTTTNLPAKQAPNTIQLLTPFNGQKVVAGFVNFAWQWTGEPLAENQTFEVRLWRKGEEIRYGAHDARASRDMIRQMGDTYFLRLDVNGAHSVMQQAMQDSMKNRAVEYEWSVALIEIEPSYQDLGIESTPFALEITP